MRALIRVVRLRAGICGRALAAISALVGLVAVVSPVAGGSVRPGPAPRVAVVVDHVDNPRGLFLDARGNLWVAAAGRAGRRCVALVSVCYGRSGRILEVHRGHARVFASALPSIRESGFGTVGADDVSVASDGQVFTAMITDDALLPPAIRKSALNGELGKLLRVGPRGGVRVEADVASHLPRIGAIGHPYGVLALPGRELVTDSELNRLLEVRNGRVRVVFRFPAGYRHADSVPTSLARGSDGTIYIGELSGINAGPGHARIWRMFPGHRPTVFATGFSAIIGLAFGPGGNLYVCEYSRDFAGSDPRGDIVQVAPDGTRTRLGLGQLFHPGGIAVSSNGTIYVSNWSTLTGTPDKSGHRGQVLQLSFNPISTGTVPLSR